MMASSGNTTSERLAELIRLRADRAGANCHKPGEMVEGAEVIIRLEFISHVISMW
jgi:hypothetical protein